MIACTISDDRGMGKHPKIAGQERPATSPRVSPHSHDDIQVRFGLPESQVAYRWIDVNAYRAGDYDEITA